MLFVLIILILPIRFRIKINAALDEGFLHAKLFLYKIFVFDLRLFIFNEQIYCKIGAKKPKQLILNPKNLFNENKGFKLFFIRQINIIYYVGGSVALTSALGLLTSVLNCAFADSVKNFKVKIKAVPIYFLNSIHFKIKVGIFTNLLVFLLGALLNAIIKLTNTVKKGEQNAIQ